MAGGNWTPSVDKIRAGIYTNFVETAQTRVSGTPQGVVAIALLAYEGLAQANTIYEFESQYGLAEVKSTLGVVGAKPVELAFLGGASKVIVYTVSKVAETEEYDLTSALAGLDSRTFNLFALSGALPDVKLTEIVTWVKTNRENIGKHFFGVYGGSTADDADPTKGNTRSSLVKDIYSINLITGGTIADVNYNSGELAPYLAGLIAGTPLNQSITYATTALSEVSIRLTPTQIETALQAGSLSFTDNEDGTIVVERGITTNTGATLMGSNKIRKVRTNMTIVSDITAIANANWIGRINNNPDGQAAVIGGILTYLDQLAVNNVIFAEGIEVGLDTNYESVGDKLYLYLKYTEVDSAEEIYLTVEAGV